MNTSLPETFLQRLHSLLSHDQHQKALAAFSCKRPTAFRINTLLDSEQNVINHLKERGINLSPFPSLKNCYTVLPEQRRPLTETNEFLAGEIYVQNPSSILPPWS